MSKKTVKESTKTPQEYLKGPYARTLIPEEGGGYSAEILEFPGCYSFGDTPDEAMRNLEDAAANWIEATLAQGQSIPEPSAHHEFSGKFLLRMPPSVQRKAAQLADRERMSLNTYLVSAISAAVGARAATDKYMEEMKRLLTQQAAQNASVLSAVMFPSGRGGVTKRRLKVDIEEETQSLPYFNVQGDN